VLTKGRAALAVVLLLVAAGSAAAGAAERPVKEHVDLVLVKKSAGATRFEHKGRATGTVAGTVRSQITITHSVVLKGTVTISTAAGKMRMNVDGRARSLGLRTKFTGKAVIAGGSGRYAHAKGTGQFTGVVNRSTWHATIEATGSFRY
jgi:hypothetical protein